MPCLLHLWLFCTLYILLSTVNAQNLKTIGQEAASYNSSTATLNIPSVLLKNTTPEQSYQVDLQYNAKQSLFNLGTVNSTEAVEKTLEYLSD